MKKILIIFMIFIQSTFANNVEVRLVKKHQGIHKEFKPYIQEFIYASEGMVKERHFKYFTMGFRDYSSVVNTVGTCHPGSNEVDISREWWKRTKSQSERLELIFHELGHCILNRGHTAEPIHDGFMAWLERLAFKLGIFEAKGYLKDGCPASFMHPYTFNETCIEKHFKYYMDELFGRFDYVEFTKDNFLDMDFDSKDKCKKPTIINKTNSWNKEDQATLDRSKQKCKKVYNSCLKKFYKEANRDYLAVCD